MDLESLLAGCIENDRKAQEMLYQSIAPKMMTVCLRYADSQYEAEEILQVGFIKLFNGIRTFAGKGSFEGWVRRIFVNTAIEMCRKKTSVKSVDAVDGEEQVFLQSFDSDRVTIQELLDMIQELPAGYRLVFNMYSIEGFSHKEIADRLNISEGASKSQLSRARARLQEKMKIIEREVDGIKS
ncbi:RNA polymerase sigma factor [Albibacterium indicum]|uniref:RNA polymerase sigma factor n=1 Tax=Albibacterium indicum TaxID=2292082 RepID=UPI000E534112|nr:RNA polymerase sigma factor [Pedobacter indicus]